MTRLRARWLGRMPYAEAWDLQRAIHDGRAAGRTDDDYLLLLEHPPTYTIGRFGSAANLLVPDDALIGLGAEVFRVDRGGDVTFHGPGQLVGYPILHLPEPMDVVGHVRRIEKLLIDTCAHFGVDGQRISGRSGVWVHHTPDRKIAAIGVRVSRGVTMHGFALNVDCDLSAYDRIVPCGISDASVTSLLNETGRATDVAAVAQTITRLAPQLTAAGPA